MKASSIKKVFFSNLVSQFLAAIIGIVILPFYSTYFDKEDYGIFMVFYMSFSWILILDLGFTNYLNKQATLYRNGKIKENIFFRVLRTYELFFLGLLLFIGCIYLLLYVFNGLTSSFLDVKNQWVVLIFLAAFLKLFTMLYKSTLDGFYKGNVASITSTSFLIARYILPLIVSLIYQFDITIFLIFQVIVSIIEAITLIILVRIKGAIISNEFVFEKKHVVNKFTLFSSISTVLYFFISQFDKVLMLDVLSIGDYGTFASIIAISNGIFYLSGPFMSTISPRLLGGYAAGKVQLTNNALNGSFQITSVIILSISFLIGSNGILILKILQPALHLNQDILFVFYCYVIGNGIYSLIGYVNIPQIAMSDLKFNTLLSFINVVITIFGVMFFGSKYGLLGLSIFWVIRNLVITYLSFNLFEKYYQSFQLAFLSKILMKVLLINVIVSLPFIYLTSLDFNFLTLVACFALSFICFFVVNRYYYRFVFNKLINAIL